MATGMPDRHQTTSQIDHHCEGFACPATDDVPRWLCVPCSSTYCDICWDRQGPHRPGKAALDSYRHEKTDRNVYDRIRKVFDSSSGDALSRESPKTLWLSGKPGSTLKQCCQQFPRYREVVMKESQGRLYEYSPSIVSFLGNTGSGMSTLVELLLASAGEDDPSQMPTRQPAQSDLESGVHLYRHPLGSKKFPVLYADCKGLAKTADSSENSAAGSSRRMSNFFRKEKKPLRKTSESPEFSLQWLVDKVYSRLLYSVSDVVVVVIQVVSINTLVWLLDLACTSLDFSIKQILLPRLVIVINNYDSPSSMERWEEAETSTTRVLSLLNFPLQEDPLSKYYSQWERIPAGVSSSSDLLRCYYSDIKVVPMPRKEKVMLVDNQVRVLDKTIRDMCNAAHTHQSQIGERPNADELQAIIDETFDHFTSRPGLLYTRTPLSFLRHSVPRDLAAHILALARFIHGRVMDDVLIGDLQVFPTITPLVASCIYTHCIQHKRAELPRLVFDKVFAPPCRSAMQAFRLRYIICQYQYDGRQCVLRKPDHASSHRMPNGTRQQGTYEELDGLDQSVWLSMVKRALSSFEDRLRSLMLSSTSDDHDSDIIAVAHTLHRRQVAGFFQGFGTSPIARFTCLGCLLEIARHQLPCGHYMCTGCVRLFGKEISPDMITIEKCPFEGSNRRDLKPCSIRVGSSSKPFNTPSTTVVRINTGGGPGES